VISVSAASFVVVAALLVTAWAYISLSRYEGSYVNILVPSLIIGVPAYYLLPLIHIRLFGTEASTYAYLYVYVTLAAENVAFVYAYTRKRGRRLRLPFTWSYQNFTLLAVASLAIGIILYAPLLLQFREFLFDPRQIYAQTRVGFGPQFFLSSALAYLAIILILFSGRSFLTKAGVVAVATSLVLLHGSKGQALNIILILALYYIYVKGRKVGLKGALVVYVSMGFAVLLFFAATMRLGDSPDEVLESISSYSDYTRNAMLVIDSDMPLQYGRIAIESNTVSLIPRALMPSKPRNFGTFFLTDKFYPEWLDADSSPGFGVGAQYADFGIFAIVYIVLFALFRGWLARAFVDRLRLYQHPGDFFVVLFLADIALFPLGTGWFLPEALFVALALRYLSKVGADKVYVERPRVSCPSSSVRTAIGGVVRWPLSHRGN